MQELDNEFFEDYKRLDRLCSDMYDCWNGVSRYIESMECQFYYGRLAVPGWEQAYKILKHLRWVRNQIAHDSGQFQICEESDLKNVNDFYSSIIAGQDPLTKLRKYREVNSSVKNSSVKRTAQPVKQSTAPDVFNHRKTMPTSGYGGCLAAAFLALAVAAGITVYLLSHIL